MNNKKNKNLRIAIVQDYIKEFGGAESVLESLTDIFPEAPIFTTLYRPQFLGPHRDRLEKKWSSRIHQSFFNYLPFAHKIISPLRLLSPLAFKSFDFSNFDLIITSATGAYFPNLINKKSAKLVCYCHTPPRYLYGLPTARNFTKNKIIHGLVSFLNIFLRKIDFKSAQNVDCFIANSKTTAARIKKFYLSDVASAKTDNPPVIVINPPVEIIKNNFNNLTSNNLTSDKLKSNNLTSNNLTSDKLRSEIYYLAGGRLARAKRYDIAIQACKLAKVSLKIFGRDFAGYESELREIAGLSAVASAKAGPTIEFLGEINQDQKAQLYSQAKAFIFCSDNEDFGIVPVESMGYGCPVIAYKSGGVTETVIDGKTGIFFNKLTPKSCAQAIQKFQKLKINPQDCVSRATDFSTQNFIQKIKDLIYNL